MKDNAPRDHVVRKNDEKKGLIIVNTGNGKGKTTAAFGLALRSLGTGMTVAIIQFIKGKWKSGEVEGLRKAFPGQVEIHQMGDGFTWETQNFEKDVASAETAWKKCKEFLFDEKTDVVIFDEINYVLKYNFLPVGDVIEALRQKPPMKHVVLTGGSAPDELIDLADLVTEMRCIKHPFEKGIMAQKGIEF